MQANEERQGNVEMIRKLRNYQKTRSYRDYAPKHVWEQSKLDNSSILFLHQEEEINLYAENIRCLEIKKGLEKKDGSKAMYDSAQFRTKVCNKHGRYSEVQVQSLFKDQTESWTRNVNDADIFQRSDADPRGRESFRETSCKSKTNTGTVINKWLGLCSYGTETMDWHWNMGVQGSSLFSSVKIH